MRKPGKRQMEALHREALIIDSHMDTIVHPVTGERAKEGYHWVRSVNPFAQDRTGSPWVQEAIGTPWSCSVASETYWSS